MYQWQGGKWWENYVFDLFSGCRTGMKSSSGSKEALSWRNWWMLIVTDSLWISIQLPSCLMVVVLEQNRLQMRSLSLSLSLSLNAHTRKEYQKRVVHLLMLSLTIVINLFFLTNFLLFAAGDGRWWWNWCNVASNRRHNSLSLLLFCFCGCKTLCVSRWYWTWWNAGWQL